MELEFKARQTSKQINIHTNKHRTLKLRCLQPPVKMERRVEWSNIICHEQTSHIFCNHFPCLCHWHNTQSVKCHTQCQHPCYITEQHITVDQTFHDFDHGRKATFRVNTNVGHTLQYWIIQPGVPFVPEI